MTPDPLPIDPQERISIHTLREEGDQSSSSSTVSTRVFLSTPSARRVTVLTGMPHVPGVKFLSTPSARRVTRCFDRRKPYFRFLSTPSARRVTEEALASIDAIIISIHTLREEGDVVKALRAAITKLFLSTPSARRVTRLIFP